MGTRTALTPNDLLSLPLDDDKQYELSEGELIVMGSAGARHESVKSTIHELIVAYKIQHPIGRVFSESLFTLGPGTARIPDVAFVGLAKLALLPDADIVIPFAPDLAVEVISESETAANAETKVNEYLAAGVLEVWQVYPRERRVRVRTSGGVHDLSDDQLIETPVLPGFRVPVSAFFA